MQIYPLTCHKRPSNQGQMNQHGQRHKGPNMDHQRGGRLIWSSSYCWKSPTSPDVFSLQFVPTGATQLFIPTINQPIKKSSNEITSRGLLSPSKSVRRCRGRKVKQIIDSMEWQPTITLSPSKSVTRCRGREVKQGRQLRGILQQWKQLPR